MLSSTISTKDAPAAIGPYSQGIRIGNLLFCSGQIAIDPATGNLVEGGIEAQTRRCCENVKALLKAAGVDASAVVKTTVFITDMNDFPKVNEVYAGYFVEPYPARSCVGVASLPKGALVEIESWPDFPRTVRAAENVPRPGGFLSLWATSSFPFFPGSSCVFLSCAVFPAADLPEPSFPASFSSLSSITRICRHPASSFSRNRLLEPRSSWEHGAALSSLRHPPPLRVFSASCVLAGKSPCGAWVRAHA